MWSSKITSRNAARIFRFCAWWTLVASVAIGILVFFPAIVDNRSVLNSLISVFFGLAGLIGSMTSLFLFVGMLTHLLKISGFSTFSKALWDDFDRFVSANRRSHLFFCSVWTDVGEPSIMTCP